jgi:hypothetical protein
MRGIDSDIPNNGETGHFVVHTRDSTQSKHSEERGKVQSFLFLDADLMAPACMLNEGKLHCGSKRIPTLRQASDTHSTEFRVLNV